MKRTKNTKIMLMVTAILLVSFSLVTTVAAATTYYTTTPLSAVKSGKDYTFIIDTSSAAPIGGATITNFGKDVDTNSIVLTIVDSKDNSIVIPIDWTQIAVNPDGSSIQFKLVKQDGLPSQAISTKVEADLTGQYDGDTLISSGPGFAWGRTR